MKHLVIALGLLVIPKNEKSLHPHPKSLTPYIQLSTQSPKLVDALIYVESRGNPKAFNPKEDAVGCLQIRPIMVREINYILEKQKSPKRFSLEDRWDCGSSKEMFYIWKNYHHKNSSEETTARAWNGGSNGPKIKTTESYWNKVKSQWEN